MNTVYILLSVTSILSGCSQMEADNSNNKTIELWYKVIENGMKSDKLFKKIIWLDDSRLVKNEVWNFSKKGVVKQYYNTLNQKIRTDMFWDDDSSWYVNKYDTHGELSKQIFLNRETKDTSIINFRSENQGSSKRIWVILDNDTISSLEERKTASHRRTYYLINNHKKVKSARYFMKKDVVEAEVNFTYEDNGFTIADSTVFEYLDDAGHRMSLATTFINGVLSEKWIYTYGDKEHLKQVTNWTPYSEKKYIVEYE